jgi:hypothetical protein
MDTRFVIWNVRSLYEAGSLKTVTKQKVEHELHLMGIQYVRWGKGGVNQQAIINYSMCNGNENHELWRGFFVYNGIISAVKRIEFVSNTISCTV